MLEDWARTSVARQVLESVVLGVVEVATADHDRVRHAEDGAAGVIVRLERCRERHDLEDRTGLVGLGEGEVVDRLIDARRHPTLLPHDGTGPRAPGVRLGVDERRVGEDLAGLHVHDNREARESVFGA